MRFGLNLPPHFRVFGGFFIYSFCIGSLFPRIPDIRAALDVAEGALGMALIGASVGTLVSLTFAGSFIDKVGFKTSLLVLIPLLSAFYAIAVHASTPLALFLLLLPVGLAIGAVEIILNLEADRVEHALGRRIMNRSHAFWSFGFFTSGLIGAAIAQMGISPQVHLALMVPIVLFGTLLLLGKFEPAPHRVVEEHVAAPRFARPTMAIAVLVAVTLSAMIMEGAGADWSAIFMADVFGVAPFFAGLAVALGAGMQAVARFFADGFVERYSPSVVARSLISILGLGALLVFFSTTPAMALLGFGLMGLGSSALFPLAMSAAAQRTDRPAAINVAALAQISFVAFFVGPPLLGFVAEHWGIRWSFGIGLPLVVLSFITAGALGSKPAPVQVN